MSRYAQRSGGSAVRAVAPRLTAPLVKPKLATGVRNEIRTMPLAHAALSRRLRSRNPRRVRRHASGRSLYNVFRDYDPQTGRYIESDAVGLIAGINTYAYSLDNPIGYFDPSGLATVDVSVSGGFMIVDPELPLEPPYVVSITTGRGQCMNNDKCTKVSNQGPIPYGKYTLNVSEISKPGLLGTLLRQTQGDWGSWRVPLHPLPATQTFGRSGFFLHGGAIPGSAGCVDFGGGIFGNALTNKLLQDIRFDRTGTVSVNVF